MKIISNNSTIGENCKIGDYVKIYDNVVIEDNVRIDDFCTIGYPVNDNSDKLIIPSGSVIRSHTVIYQGSKFESKLETGHHVLIRERTIAGKNLRVGSYTDIEGDCIIGDYVRFHSYVHIGKGSKIGNFVWIYSLCTLTNDPLPPSHIEKPVIIEDGVVICVNSTILPGAVLKYGSFIASGSIVDGIIDPGLVIEGKNYVRGHVSKLINFEQGIKHPWMNHFYDKYPEQEHQRIKILGNKIVESYSKTTGRKNGSEDIRNNK